jgi:hypothetical protein
MSLAEFPWKSGKYANCTEPRQKRGELSLDVAECADFEEYHASMRGYLPADPTLLHMALMALKHRLWLPRLSSVIEAPLLLPSGRLIDQPGYNAKTGLHLETSGVVFPPVPERPSKGACLQALQLLEEGRLAEFLFVDAMSKSVALSVPISTCPDTSISRPNLWLLPCDLPAKQIPVG